MTQFRPLVAWSSVVLVMVSGCYKGDDPSDSEPVSPSVRVEGQGQSQVSEQPWVEFGILHDNLRGEQQRTARMVELGAFRVRHLRTIPGMLVRVPPARADDFARQAQSLGWVQNFERIDGSGVTAADDYTWAGTQMLTPVAHGLGYTGDGIKVGVIDGAVDCGHSDLSGQVMGGTNTIGGSAYCATADTALHGTAVAGIIAAKGNGAGLVGVAPGAHLYAIRACQFDASRPPYSEICDDGDVVEGLDWALSNGMKVVNISIGGCDGNLPALAGALYAAAASAHVAIVAAAGNGVKSNGDCHGGPIARWAKPGTAFAVSAHDSVAGFNANHQQGSEMDYSAPGLGVKVLVPGGAPSSRSGSSLASPQVAGAIAVLFEAGFNTLSWVRQRLDLGAMPPHNNVNRFGVGRVNVARAVQGLTAGIDGPSYIGSEGWQDWDAWTDRGVPPFVYQWERIDWCTGARTYSSAATYSEYVFPESAFVLNLTVTDTILDIVAGGNKNVGFLGGC